MINKRNLQQALINHLELQLAKTMASAETARKAAIDDQSKAETQYDTLGLEASYLAHGHSERAQALISDIQRCKEGLEQLSRSPKVQLGSIVGITSTLDDSKQDDYFVAPAAAGLVLLQENKRITVITPQAPLAQAIWACELDDEVRIIKKGQQIIAYISELD
ncbi:hypothetical protein [Thalassotalea aquiviva]|uniref:hypothetical protein n=1 Tax=Thalassotalea aquiviva TaxID=3242415 RepID=UPI00352A183F